MNKILLQLLLIVSVLQSTMYGSDTDIIQEIHSLQTDLNTLQNQALEKNISEPVYTPLIQEMQNQLQTLLDQSNALANTDNFSERKPNNLDKVSDKAVKKAHYGLTHEKNTLSEKTSAPTVTPQSMENGKDDFNPDTIQNDQDASTLHVADQENLKDANSDPDKKSHQSFFLGEGMVNVQALLLENVDAFDTKSKKGKKIGSYKRSLNFVQGYSIGTITIGKKTIQVLEDNAASRTPILAVIENGISKKPLAYIKNPGYNKMIKKSPAIINLYEYKL